MEKGRRDTVLLTVIGIATLLVAIVGATFAYFTAQLNGTNRTSTVIIRSSAGSEVVYHSANFTESNMYPRDAAWAVKPFRLVYSSANATYNYTYSLTLHYSNEFAADQLTYTLAHVGGYCSDGTKADQISCEAANGTWNTDNVSNTGAVATTGHVGTYIPTGSGTLPLGTGTFAANNGQPKTQIHSYTLTINYPNKANVNQNSEQGHALSLWIEAVETTNSNS